MNPRTIQMGILRSLSPCHAWEIGGSIGEETLHFYKAYHISLFMLARGFYKTLYYFSCFRESIKSVLLCDNRLDSLVSFPAFFVSVCLWWQVNLVDDKPLGFNS